MTPPTLGSDTTNDTSNTTDNGCTDVKGNTCWETITVKGIRRGPSALGGASAAHQIAGLGEQAEAEPETAKTNLTIDKRLKQLLAVLVQCAPADRAVAQAQSNLTYANLNLQSQI